VQNLKRVTQIIKHYQRVPEEKTMRVSELKEGMLLTCSNDGDSFSIYGTEKTRWLRVVVKPSRFGRSTQYAFSNTLDTRVIMYLGTKKDMNMKVGWSNRFALVDDEIVAIDPAAWRRIGEFNAE
jgi:hypothetical protein